MLGKDDDGEPLALEHNHVDLAVVDVSLPDSSGLEPIGAVRAATGAGLPGSALRCA